MEHYKGVSPHAFTGIPHNKELPRHLHIKARPMWDEQPVCYKTKLEDIDFIEASSGSEMAVKLLRFCSVIYKHNCDLKRIAGPGNLEHAELLQKNANCQLRTEELVVYSLTLVLCLITIVANLIELILIFKYKRLRTSTNCMIVSLAISDLLFGASAIYTTIMNILTSRAEHDYDSDALEKVLDVRSKRTLCLLLDGPGFMFGCMMASIFTLTAIAVEKYIAIFHPLKYYQWMTNKTIAVILIVVWIVSLLFGLMPLMGWNSFDGICLFVEKTSYEFLITWASTCLLCATGTFVLYFKIFLTARKHARQIAQRQANYPIATVSGATSQDPVAMTLPIKCRSTHTVEPLPSVNSARTAWEKRLNRKTSVKHLPLPIIRNSPGHIDVKSCTNMVNHICQKKTRIYVEVTPGSSVKACQCFSYQVSDLSGPVTSIPEEITADKQGVASQAEEGHTCDSIHELSDTKAGLSKNEPSTSVTTDSNTTTKCQPQCLKTGSSFLDSPEIIFKTLRLRSSFSLSKAQVFSPPGVKAVKTLAIILGTFYMCWLPLLFYLVSQPGKYSNFTIYCLSLVALLNGLLNPLVYGFHSPSLRLAFKKLCRGGDRNIPHSRKTTEHQNSQLNDRSVYDGHI